MSFWKEVCKEEIPRLPESPKAQTNFPEFHQYELATLGRCPLIALVAGRAGAAHRGGGTMRKKYPSCIYFESAVLLR